MQYCSKVVFVELYKLCISHFASPSNTQGQGEEEEEGPKTSGGGPSTSSAGAATSSGVGQPEGKEAVMSVLQSWRRGFNLVVGGLRMLENVIDGMDDAEFGDFYRTPPKTPAKEGNPRRKDPNDTDEEHA